MFTLAPCYNSMLTCERRENIHQKISLVQLLARTESSGSACRVLRGQTTACPVATLVLAGEELTMRIVPTDN